VRKMNLIAATDQPNVSRELDIMSVTAQ
jgi:hypothetical protein